MKSFFKRKSRILWICEKIKNYFSKDPLVRISTDNRLKDYKQLLSINNKKLWDLHKELERIRIEALKSYKSYDYGNGYYYQSMKKIHITGYRDTSLRIKELSLEKRLKNKTVLDIGANTGFLLLSLADIIKFGFGVELNPYLVSTSKAVADFMKVSNINFFFRFF